MTVTNTNSKKAPLNVAYTIQNVGGIDFQADVGDAVPVKYTLLGLQNAGHKVHLFRLHNRRVLQVTDFQGSNSYRESSLGVTDTSPYLLFESGVRRLQHELKIPYFAAFDSHRFYEACVRALPRFDLCHEHNGLLSVGAALACRRTGTPYVLTFSADPLLEMELMGKSFRGIHGAIARRAAKFTYDAADKIICVSEPAKEHLSNNWGVDPDKISVMPNGVDVSLFNQPVDETAVRAELGVGEAPVVMFVGWFQQWHGLDKLVESFSQVRREAPEARLVLVGDGSVRGDIEAKIKALGLNDAVSITGLVPRAQVPRYLAIADVTTLPYPPLPKEIWFSPLKLYEYMAAGKAIVGSRSGQIAEVIQHGENGWLVEPGNVSELADAIVRLIKSPADRQRLGQQAKDQAKARHSWTQYVRRLEEIYLSVL